MKKFIYMMFAVVLFATSCESGDYPPPTGEPNEIECTFVVNAPTMGTRAGDISGSGKNAATLHWRFFDENNQPLDLKTITHGGVLNNEGVRQWIISPTLVAGRVYYLYLWAGTGDYISNSLSRLYFTDFNSASGEPKVTVNKNYCYANNDNYDVFCNKVKITAGVDPGVIYLYRPTAQLNIATRDVEEAAALGAPIVSSSIICKMVTTYDFDGVNMKVTNPFTFKSATIPTHTVMLDDGTGEKEYRVISLNYIMMENAEKELQNITFSYSEDEKGKVNSVTREFTAVPIQRNHRTYIVGESLLTTDCEYTLVVQPIMDPASDKTVTVSAR